MWQFKRFVHNEFVLSFLCNTVSYLQLVTFFSKQSSHFGATPTIYMDDIE